MSTARTILAALLAVFMLAPPALAAPVLAAGFVDDAGRQIAPAPPALRIISLYGAHTENLFSLGLSQEVVGVSRGEDYPPAALDKPVFSYRDDPERLLAARPDLVLIRPMIWRGHRAWAQSLTLAGVRVVALQPRGFSEMYRYWRRLGQLTGRGPQAKAMVEKFQRGLADLEARVAGIPRAQRPRVFFESIHSKRKTFAPGSIAIFALTAAGGVNLAQKASSVRSTNIAEYGTERILSHAVEMDVYLAQQGAMNKVELETIKKAPGFSALKAVRNRQVYLIDERLVSRPTLRLLLGISKIQAMLYPKMAVSP